MTYISGCFCGSYSLAESAKRVYIYIDETIELQNKGKMMIVAKKDTHKEILARLLASEGINVQHAHLETAMFDLKTRTLLLPIWREDLSNDVYDLLIGHEVGHALWTDAEKYKDAVLSKKAPACYYNIVEDARIEKKIKRKYPGLKKNFYIGYQELEQSEHFGKKIAHNIQNMNLIDRINVYFKMGYIIDVPFADEEKDFLSRTDAAESFQAVRQIAEDIYQYSKDRQSETDTEGRSHVDDDGKDNGKSESSDTVSGDDTQNSDAESSDGSADSDGEKKKDKENNSNQDTKKDSNPANDGPEAPDDGKGSADGNKDSDKEDGDEDSENDVADEKGDVGGRDKHSRPGSSNPVNFEDLDSQTEKASIESTKKLVDRGGKEKSYLRFGNYQYKNITEDYKLVYKYIKEAHQDVLNNVNNDVYYDAETVQDDLDNFFNKGKECLLEFKKNFSKSITHMAQTFEMKKRADEYKRQMESKTGILSPIKLHAYKYEDNLFKKSMVVAEGKNHGLIFFIDWSSSMASVINSTMKQLFCLTMFCKKVNIPFEVYAFSNNELCNGEKDHPLENINDIIDTKYIGVQGDFKLMNILSSRMSIKDYNYATEYLMAWSLTFYSRWVPDPITMSGTPLQGAIAVSENLIKDFQKQNKLQIVNAIYLTDGDSAQDIGIFNDQCTGISGFGGRRLVSLDIIVVDDKTKKEYEMSSFCRSHAWTDLLVKILSDRVECNIIGFNITSSIPGWIENLVDEDAIEIRKIMRKNKFYGTTNTGYSDYYLIPPSSMKIESSELEIEPGMTTRKMRSVFAKHHLGRKSNRVLLNRFIEQII